MIREHPWLELPWGLFAFLVGAPAGLLFFGATSGTMLSLLNADLETTGSGVGGTAFLALIVPCAAALGGFSVGLLALRRLQSGPLIAGLAIFAAFLVLWVAIPVLRDVAEMDGWRAALSSVGIIVSWAASLIAWSVREIVRMTRELDGS